MRVGRERLRRDQNARRGLRRGRWIWLVPAVALLAAAAAVILFVVPRPASTSVAAAAAVPAPAAAEPSSPASPGTAAPAPAQAAPAPAPGARKSGADTLPLTPAPRKPPGKPPAPVPHTASRPPAVTVVIDSPAAGSPLFSRVSLRGRFDVPSGSVAEIESARWTIEGTDRSGALRWTGDGSFQAELPTDGLTANLTITVSARLRSGDTGRASATLVDRGKGPGIFIQSPRPRSAYGSAVRVWGQVRGPVEAPVPLAEVQSLSWSVDGTRLGGALPYGRDGVFDFSFSTVGLHGALTVSVVAADRNGRRSVSTLALSDRPGGPALRVDSPADKAEYGAAVAVSGRVGDSSDPSGTPAEVKKLSWRIVGQPSLSGRVPRKPDGRFAFSFSSTDLVGPQTLELQAEDRNGRSTTSSIALVAPVASRPPSSRATAAVIAQQPPSITPPPQPPAGEGPAITIAAPSAGGFYRDITIVEGRVRAAQGAKLKSLGWEAAGMGKSGKVAADSAGAFKLPLDLSDVTGDLSLVLTGEDTNGGTSRATLTLYDGRLRPAITLSSPTKGGSYGSLIRVSGAVVDPYAGRAGMEGIDSASYLLAPVSLGRSSAPARGTITLGPGGAFRFNLPASGLSGDQDLTLTVVSRNGNRAQVSVRLSQGDGDLPGFHLVPEDRTVVASWEAIPFVQRYDLFVAADGAPSDQPRTMTGVTPPVKVSGLENGRRYTLQVKAFFDDDTTGLSSVVRFIPLSPQTLAPMVTGEYQEIRLSWNGIPGAAAYDVWRSHDNGAGSGGDYDKVAAGLASTSFRDAAVEFGREYSYTISPASILAPMSAPGSARSLAFPEDKLALIGHLSLQGARGVTVSGGYAFVASGARGAQVIDVSNPAAPVKVGQIDAADAWDVEVRGNYAYVADGDSGLRVLDISAPREPVEIGLRKTNDARALAFTGKYAYVADGDKGLKVIDISNARELPRVGQVDTQNALGLAMDGGLLYLADGPGGLKVFNVSRPTAPALVGSLATTDARQVDLQGTIAVVADGAAGLRVVDLSDPARPALLATLDTGMAAAVSLENGFAYVADGKNGVTVVNVEDPSRPSAFVTQTAAGASGVVVKGRLALITGRTGLDVVRMQIIGRSFTVASCDATGKAFDVSVSGDWAYVASHAEGMRLVDVKEPGAVKDGSLAGGIGTRFAQSVSVKDNLAFVADGASGVRIIDVSPAWTAGGKPVDVGAYRPGGTVSRAVPGGTLLYLAAGDRGVQILDVSTPSAPAVVSSVRTRDASDVVMKDTWAFVADGAGGVRVLDVTNPASPVMLPAVIRGDANRLALTGSLLVVAGDSGVSFIDVSNPGAPRLESRYATASAQSVAVQESYVYVAEGYKGLTVLDVSRPEHPAVVTTCDEVFAGGVAVKNDYAIVADPRGLRIVQVLIPSWLKAKTP